MILIAAFAMFGMAIFIVVVALVVGAMCAALEAPLFAETPGDEFADDFETPLERVDRDIDEALARLDEHLVSGRIRVCARPHCDLPQHRDSLCLPHWEWMADCAYEFRREIEDYQRMGLS